MTFTVLGEGFVTRRPAGPGLGAIAAGPRTILRPGGDLLCSCVLSSGLGVNDFTPVLFRSTDYGWTWTEQGLVWPHLRQRWSMFASLSRNAGGQLFFFGSRTPIDRSGEPFWSDATQGLKQNELIWATSTDLGQTWSEPTPIPMPIPGAAEAPAPLCSTRHGRWLAPYSPYNTFDPALAVERNQVVAVYSDDRGRAWQHTAMLRFGDLQSGGAEAWLIELSDGRLLGAGWQLGHDGVEHPDAYALSHDGGTTWGPTRSTGVMGQSVGLAPLPEGRALFVYNQRRHGEPGVHLAVVRPTDADFGIEADAIVWRARTATQKGTSGEHTQWTDFSFGEPHVIALPDGTLLVTLWSIQPDGTGIRYVKVRPDG